MKSFILWFSVVAILFFSPRLVFAQGTDNLSRAQVIALQMNCVEGQLSASKGIGWNDVCDVPQAPPQSTDTSSQPASSQDNQSQITSLGDQTNTSPLDNPFAPIATRIISDPLFLPLKGQFYGATSYTYQRSTSNTYNYQGVLGNAAVAEADTYSQLLEYGFTDDLSVLLSENYKTGKAIDTSIPGGAQYKYDNDGLGDPEIGVTYRVIDQAKASPVDFDLSADYLPNVFRYKAAAIGQEGTVAAGSQQTIFTASVGREMKAFTVQGFAQAIFTGDKRYQALSTNDSYDDKSVWGYEFGINTQTRLTDRFSVNLGVSYNVNNNQNGHNLTSDLSWISVLANTLAANIALNYQIIPDRLVGTLSYTYEANSTSKVLFVNPTEDDEVRQNKENVAGAQLSYLFN